MINLYIQAYIFFLKKRTNRLIKFFAIFLCTTTKNDILPKKKERKKGRKLIEKGKKEGRKEKNERRCKREKRI